MRIDLAARAAVALAAGLVLHDCVLLGGALLLWTAHLHASLNAEADRAHGWLRCIGQGAALIALGLALAGHTAGVVLGWWSGPMNDQPWLAGVLLLLLALTGASPLQPRALRHGLLLLALIAVLAPPLVGVRWAPCAFAALVAALALGSGGYRLGPLARTLAAPGRWQ